MKIVEELLKMRAQLEAHVGPKPFLGDWLVTIDNTVALITEDQDAFKEGQVEESGVGEHPARSQSGTATEAGGGDSPAQGGQGTEKVMPIAGSM